jgi:hypothetical protein
VILESATIELILPPSYNQSGDGVPSHVDSSAAHAEEAIDAENQSHSGDGYCGDNHHGADESNKGSALHAAGALGGEQGDAENSELLSKS